MQRKPRFVYKEICRQFEIAATPASPPFGSVAAGCLPFVAVAGTKFSSPPLIVHNKVDPLPFVDSPFLSKRGLTILAVRYHREGLYLSNVKSQHKFCVENVRIRLIIRRNILN